ncbi:lanthionine synthetase C family protein [Roseateles sp. DC23W]|uniref:Lanthionine synthetase C family protein n=1 Tax=Pelomonas dachongensis TaxID=3299029 RepID=A0ABW7EUX5_9BURK
METFNAARSSFDGLVDGLASEPGDVDISLASGMGGALLYRLFVASDAQADQGLMHGLASYFKRVANSRSFTAGLYGGTTGCAFTIEMCARRVPEIRPGVEKYLDTVDGMLIDYLDSYGHRMHFDLVSGFVGMGVYALLRTEHGRPDLMMRVIDVLQSRAEHVDVGATWRTSPTFYGMGSSAEKEPLGNFNLGVAHGVPGVICLLAELVDQKVRVDELRPLLQASIHWLLSSKLRRATGRTQYPHIYGESSPSRLAWCYGDVGIGWALLKAGLALDSPELLAEAKSALLSSFDATALYSGVKDSSLCHGSAGLCLMLHRANRLVPDPDFEEALRYWYDELHIQIARDGNKTLPERGGDMVTRIGPLSGFSGVALAIHDMEGTVVGDWSRWLLI